MASILYIHFPSHSLVPRLRALYEARRDYTKPERNRVLGVVLCVVPKVFLTCSGFGWSTDSELMLSKTAAVDLVDSNGTS